MPVMQCLSSIDQYDSKYPNMDNFFSKSKICMIYAFFIYKNMGIYAIYRKIYKLVWGGNSKA